MSKNERKSVRKPATKLPNLQKKLLQQKTNFKVEIKRQRRK